MKKPMEKVMRKRSILSVWVPLFLLLPVLGTAQEVKPTTLLPDKLSAYTVELKQVVPDTCQESQFQDIKKKKFYQGVCVFHNKSTEADNEKIITFLQQAQLSGLPPVYQNFAALLEGLAHCRQADIYFKNYERAGKQDILERIKFCRERRLSLGSLSDVNWEYAYFDYEPANLPRFTLNDRLNEMATCHGGVLNHKYHAECGYIDNMTDAEVETLVESAVKDVMDKFFEGESSVITGMFVRKAKRAEGLVNGAAATIENLKKEAAPVNKKYASFDRVYKKAKEESLSKIVSDYRTSVLKANSILDEYNRWKGGLFITPENVNLMPKIKERKKEMDEEMQRVSEEGYVTKAGQVAADLKGLISGDKENYKMVKELCHIYFCEFLNKRALIKMTRVCRQPRMLTNPLCVDVNGKLVNGKITVEFDSSNHTKSVMDLCKDAGLADKYAKVGLEAQEANACLNEI